MADGKVEVRNVNAPHHVTRVDAVKYEAMRAALMAVLPGEAEAITVADAKDRLLAHLSDDLFPGGAKAGWWQKTVQLDLEARGLVGRTADKPMRIYKV